jgi:putative MATE family efflux protein
VRSSKRMLLRTHAAHVTTVILIFVLFHHPVESLLQQAFRPLKYNFVTKSGVLVPRRSSITGSRETSLTPSFSRQRYNFVVTMAQPSETDPLLTLQLPLETSNPDELPPVPQKSTGQQILELAIPAAAALLIDPLMTLADTAFVGRYSETPDQLAGMGSAAPLLTFSFYLFNFLCTATTPLIASRRAAGKEQEAIALGGQALSLALVLGGFLTLTLLLLKQTLLRVMGTGITGDSANEYALAFLSVRALAAPAVLCIEASTGVLRGYLDTTTPIFVLIFANLLNLVLDVALIVFAGMGPLGAAIATTTAEWVSAGLFLGVLAGRLPSATGELGRSKDQEIVAQYIVPTMSIPPWEDIQPLIVASSAVFFRAVVLQLSLSAAAAMAARGGGTGDVAAATVAAHQIGIQLWLLCSFFCDSLAAASQGLVADAMGREDPAAVRDVSKTVFTYGLMLGLFLGALLQAGDSTGLLFDIFTKDEAIRATLGKILPLIILAQPLNALVFAADGVLQGASEFPFQARAMALSGLIAVGTFVVLERGIGDVDTLVHIWTALIALQFMRGVTSLWKLVERDGPINLLALKW